MNVNQRAIDLIKRFEGFVPDAYRDAVGVWTIGYGTTAMAGVGISPKPGMKITEAEADMYLRRAVEKFADKIEPGFTRNPNENQFGAFVSLAYNVGPGAVLKSTALRKWNMGDLEGVRDGFRMFNKAGGSVLNGLVRRREAEIELFNSPVRMPPAMSIEDFAKASDQMHQGFWLSLASGLVAVLQKLFRKA